MKRTELSKKYSNKEMAESFIFRHNLNKKQKVATDIELLQARKAIVEKMSPEKKLLAGLLQLKFQMEDYTEGGAYDTKLNFGFFLREYLKYLKKKSKEFAADMDIHHTELSQMINNRRSPSDKFIIRLEIHSNKTIPAISWYKLVEKEKEYRISTDNRIRMSEKKHVKNGLQLNPIS